MSKLALLLFIVGTLILCNVRLPQLNMRRKFQTAAQSIERVRRRTGESGKDYVARIDGRKKESFARRSYSEAQEVYQKIGQEEKYQQMLQTALLCAIGGAVAGFCVFHNWMLAAVLGVGCYFLPLWLTQFSLYHYERFLGGELETALSLITTSYLRNDDILAAVEENLVYLNSPVRETFTTFCNTVKYIDANTPAAIELLKNSLDHALFRQWCDALLLCQENHILQATLPGIVSKFSDLKAQQEANETKMMLPLRQAISMVTLTAGFIPLMYLVNQNWYGYLIGTFFGQLAVTLTAVVVFFTIHKAIRLSKPIGYEV